MIKTVECGGKFMNMVENEKTMEDNFRPLKQNLRVTFSKESHSTFFDQIFFPFFLPNNSPLKKLFSFSLSISF